MRTDVWKVGVVAALLAGCATLDRPALTEFEPTATGFKYTAKTDRLVYKDDEAGEKTRIEWLGRYLEDNKLCPVGYRVTERRVVDRGFAPPMIYYYGVCN